jgi:hypothetical protein
MAKLVFKKKVPQGTFRSYVVDRVEEDGRGNRIAVLENQDDLSMMDLPTSRLPQAAREDGALFSVPLRNGQPQWAMAKRNEAGEVKRLARYAPAQNGARRTDAKRMRSL